MNSSLTTLRITTRTLFASRDRATSFIMLAAFALPHAVLLSVLGGIHTFFERSNNPVNEAMSEGIYLLSACVAGVLLIVPILSMAVAAARLGLERRSRDVAVLRLLGVGPSVSRWACILDTCAHAAAGIILGSVLYLVVLPAWQLLTFQDVPLAASEMMLPLSWIIDAALVMLFLASLSAWSAMRKVSITPLGVMRRSEAMKINPLPAIITVVMLIAWFGAGRQLLALSNSEVMLYTILFGFLGVIFLGMNAIGVLSMSVVGRIIARTATSAPAMVAGRRIADNPKAVWRSTGAVALSGFVFAVLYPAMHAIDQAGTAQDASAYENVVMRDLSTGLLLTLSISVVLSIISTMLTQAIRLIDQVPHDRALRWIGATGRTIDMMSRLEIALPAAISIALAVIGGLIFGAPFALMANAFLQILLTVGYTLLAVGVIVASSMLVSPLRKVVVKA
ncbi:hypothetical protein [Actinomyces vulturis]|uniref:hypothetical protein n=1 Tax=Actinomyces vulturis TaxID=1857645 RepID=UPI00082F13A7|nr:hypothetical protein [Actinomyces vulturis]